MIVNPTISIIVPSYNGAEKISILLNALVNQKTSANEVIVVLDGSTDNTKHVVHSFNKFFNHLRIIEIPNGGRSVARNFGVKNSTGNIIVFYDDDIRPQPDSIQKHLAFHLKHNGLLTGNPVELIEQEKTDIQNYKAHLTEVWTAKYPEGVSKLTQQNLFFTAANCSIKKEDFFKLNGFDERLTDAEDFDLAFRALEKGYSVYFDKSNKAIHHDPITCHSYIRRIRQYQQAQQKLSLLHPERRKKKYYLNPLKQIFYFFFSWRFLPALIDRFSLVQRLPKQFRYKLYSIVIHSLGVVYPNRKLE